MSLVHEPVQLRAAEPQLDLQLRSEGPGVAAEGADRHVLDPAQFGERDHVLAEPRSITDVLLTPAEPVAQRAEPSSQSIVVHWPMIADATHPALIGDGPARHRRRPTPYPAAMYASYERATSPSSSAITASSMTLNVNEALPVSRFRRAGDTDAASSGQV